MQKTSKLIFYIILFITIFTSCTEIVDIENFKTNGISVNGFFYLHDTFPENDTLRIFITNNFGLNEDYSNNSPIIQNGYNIQKIFLIQQQRFIFQKIL